jgi:transcriptional regulator with XRE-family HTH domain
MKDIGDRMASRRRELKLSKKDLANQVGIHHSIITRIESGQCQNSKHIFDIADALNVDVDWLVRGRIPNLSEQGFG